MPKFGGPICDLEYMCFDCFVNWRGAVSSGVYMFSELEGCVWRCVVSSGVYVFSELEGCGM